MTNNMICKSNVIASNKTSVIIFLIGNFSFIVKYWVGINPAKNLSWVLFVVGYACAWSIL